MKQCPVCHSHAFYPIRMQCDACQLEVAGKLHTPVLARLSTENQQLAVQLLLHGGNLKTLAEELQITYPTLRKRLDQAIDSLTKLLKNDQVHINTLLADIEQGNITSEEGIRRIREIQSEL